MNGNYNLYKNLTTAELNAYARNMIETLETLEALKDENGEAFKNIEAVAATSKHKKLVDTWTCNAYIYFTALFYKSARLQSQMKDLYIFGVTEDVEDIVLNIIIKKLSEKDGFLHPTNKKFTKSFLNVCGENVFRDVYKRYIRKSASDKANKANKNPTFISTDEELFDENGKSITREELIPDLQTPETFFIERSEKEEFIVKNYIGNYLYSMAEKGDIDLILVVLSTLSKEDIISSINTVSSKEFLSLINKQAETVNASFLQNISVSKIMSLMSASTTSLLLSNANTDAKLVCITDKTKQFHKDMKNMFNIKKPRKRKVIS